MPTPTEWKQGKLLSLDIRSQSRIIGDDDEIVTVVRPVFTYTIDGGDLIHDVREIGSDGRRTADPIRVEVNTPVQYVVDKDHFYIKDSNGKSHKLDLVRTRAGAAHTASKGVGATSFDFSR